MIYACSPLTTTTTTTFNDVEEAVKKMRDFRNEKKATEGEFRLDSPINRKFFTDYYKEELQKIEEELAPCAVKISLDESGNRIKYSGTDDGVKDAEERLYILLDQIKEKSLPIQTPGMRNFLAQDAGKSFVDTVERENKCIIRIAEEIEEEVEDKMEGSDGDELSNTSSRGEEELDDADTFLTNEGKKVIWKSGNIEEEQVGSLIDINVSNNKSLRLQLIQMDSYRCRYISKLKLSSLTLSRTTDN